MSATATEIRTWATDVRESNPKQAAMFDRFAARAERTESLRATRGEILRLKALQSEGNLMAGLGVRPWDRERGAQTAQRATDALVALMGTLSVEDLAHMREMGS